MPGKPGPMVSVLLSYSFFHLLTHSSICTFINIYEAPAVVPAAWSKKTINPLCLFLSISLSKKRDITINTVAECYC